ncbi:hypothetical protein Tco_0351421 [Tanacetum coccineum]
MGWRGIANVDKYECQSVRLSLLEGRDFVYLSPVVVKYDQHAYFGTSHWGLKRQSFYRYASNLTSSKDVYSRRRIIAVTRLTIMKKYDYGHLEEINVRRDDQKLYTFKKGDFKRLCLQYIEDMLLLLVQQKLTNLTIDKRYDLNVALRMFTKCIVIQRRVEDLQLGFKRKRLMRTDELHKFSDGTLSDVRTALHDIAAGIRIEYLPMRKWSNLDKKRARVMVQDIDKQLYQRSQNRRDLPRDIPLDSVVVLRYEKRSKGENTGRVPTEMELVLEQTQQGSIYTDQRGIVVFPMMAAARRGRVRFIAVCSYSTGIHKDIMKAQVHVSRLPLL